MKVKTPVAGMICASAQGRDKGQVYAVVGMALEAGIGGILSVSGEKHNRHIIRNNISCTKNTLRIS